MKTNALTLRNYTNFQNNALFFKQNLREFIFGFLCEIIFSSNIKKFQSNMGGGLMQLVALKVP